MAAAAVARGFRRIAAAVVADKRPDETTYLLLNGLDLVTFGVNLST